MDRSRLRPEHRLLLAQMETILMGAGEDGDDRSPPGERGPEGLARALLAEARRRARVFGELEFHDPQWLMLLDLFVAGRQGREICVSSLCIASGVPATTALRHIAFLEVRGMVRKRAHPRDSRRCLVTLTEAATDRLLQYLAGAEQLFCARPAR